MAKAKEVTGKIKLQITGGQATPAPPVGPALGQHGVPIGDFVKQFNDRTADQKGTLLPVEITVFGDRTFEFILKSPPASVLLKKAAGIAKGAQNVRTEVVGKVNRDQLVEIAKVKANDLRAFSEDAAVKIIAGTARSMGIQVED